MKNSLRLLAATLAIFAGASAFAQSPDSPPAHGPHFGPPPGTVNDDGTITLPDGTVLPAPTFNADGTITLPDGTVIDPNADGTYTLPDGHVIDLSKAPPVGGPGGPGGGPGGHRGPPP